MIIGYIIAAAAGLATTMQASANAETRRLIKSPYLVAAINFIVSIAVLVVIIAAVWHNFYMPLSEVTKYPPWIWVGGACGPVVIMTNSLCIPKLGSARQMMLASTAQVLVGLMIDQFGLFGQQQISMNVARALGAMLVIGGIFVSAIDKNAQKGKGNEKNLAIYILLAIVNGAAASVQVAANGTLNNVVDNFAKTALISMIIGLLTTTVLMIAIAVIRGRSAIFEEGGSFEKVGFSRFMIYGGTLAVIVVGGNAIAANILGTGLVNIMNLAGMMATSLVIDATGFLGIEKKAVTVAKVVGMIMIVAGTAIISLIA